MSDLTMRVDSEEYLLRREDDGLRVGRPVSGEVSWLDTVDLGLLPGPAREALERGDTSDEALLTAVRGVVQAEVERGG
jgi:hypothetical protein